MRARWYHKRLNTRETIFEESQNDKIYSEGDVPRKRDLWPPLVPLVTREDFRQLGHTWNLAGAEIREFIVAVYRRINRVRRRAAQRVASRFPDTLRWRVVTSRDKRQRGCYLRAARVMLSAWRYATRKREEERIVGCAWQREKATSEKKKGELERVYDARKEIEG